MSKTAGDQDQQSRRAYTGAHTELILDALYIPLLHSYLACLAFSGALVLGCLLHYKKIVKNGVAGYPDEWFPSVSATQVYHSYLRHLTC